MTEISRSLPFRRIAAGVALAGALGSTATACEPDPFLPGAKTDRSVIKTLPKPLDFELKTIKQRPLNPANPAAGNEVLSFKVIGYTNKSHTKFQRYTLEPHCINPTDPTAKHGLTALWVGDTTLRVAHLVKKSSVCINGVVDISNSGYDQNRPDGEIQESIADFAAAF